ncbi:MAG TPA: MATE family efflux transporter [Gemmatimonadaceae bacterium]|nr:MATE family efflux transporter [Gemmatimonadaceae bacterium]
MSEPLRARTPDEVRPPDEVLAAALPLDARDGIAPVAARDIAPPILAYGSLPRLTVAVALPAVASMLLMTLFGTVDAYWVGTRVGPQGLAAVSTSIFVIWSIIACAELVSVGLTAVASRRHGEGHPSLAARATGDALVMALILAALVLVFGQLGLGWIFAVMQTPPEVTELGRRYLGTYLLGAPLIFGFFVIDASFRASGDTRTPFLLLLTTVFGALALDPVLILGLGPAPKLGIAGAAVATIFTRSVAFLIGVVLLARRRLISIGRPSAHTIGAIVRVGLPTALTGIFFSNVYILLTRTTTKYGTPALASLGIGHRVESWVYMMGVGFGAAAAAIVGQNLGARRLDRAERAGWLATGFATAVGAVGAALEYLLAPQVSSAFTTNAAVAAEGARYLRIGSVSTLFSSAELVLEGALGGAGDTVPPMLTSTTLTVLRLPLAAWAAPRFGTAGIWWTISLTAAGRGLAMMALWRWGRWKRKSL